MSFWKVLGGVAAGIGTVACLPVAGAVGAVTLAGAAVAGTVGGIAGAAVAMNDEECEEELSESRENNNKLKARIAMQETFIKECEKDLEKLSPYEAHAKYLVSLVAIGVAAANADGMISPEEEEALDAFVLGMSQSRLPDEVLSTIEDLKNNPPNLVTAVKIAEEMGCLHWKRFDQVINLVIDADEKINDKEKAFLQAFRNMAA